MDEITNLLPEVVENGTSTSTESNSKNEREVVGHLVNADGTVRPVYAAEEPKHDNQELSLAITETQNNTPLPEYEPASETAIVPADFYINNEATSHELTGYMEHMDNVVIIEGFLLGDGTESDTTGNEVEIIFEDETDGAEELPYSDEELFDINVLSANLDNIAEAQENEPKNPFFERHPQLEKVFDHLTAAAVGAGTKVGLKQAAGAAGILSGPIGIVAGGAIGGASKYAKTQYEIRRNPNILWEKYVDKFNRKAEDSTGLRGVYWKTRKGFNTLEMKSIETAYGVNEREDVINATLQELGVEVDENGQILVNGEAQQENSAQLIGALQSREIEQDGTDRLLANLEIQGKLAKFSSSHKPEVKAAYERLHLELMALNESDPAQLNASLDAAAAELETRLSNESINVLSMKLGGIEALKSAGKAAIGVGIAEALTEVNWAEMGANLGEHIAAVGEHLKVLGAELAEKGALLNQANAEYAAALGKRAKVFAEFNGTTEHLEHMEHLETTLGGIDHNIENLTTQHSMFTAAMNTEHLEAIDFNDVGVEIPEGSTVGEGLAGLISEQGTDINIWDTESSNMWGAMVFENQGSFFKDAYAMAESVNDSDWLNTAAELGFNPETGIFDTEKIMSLVEKANSGDRESLRELYNLFHWVRAGHDVQIPIDIESVLNGGLVQEVITTTVGNFTPDELHEKIELLEMQMQMAGDDKVKILTELNNLKDGLVTAYGTSDANDIIEQGIKSIEDAAESVEETGGIVGAIAGQVAEVADNIDDALDNVDYLEAEMFQRPDDPLWDWDAWGFDSSNAKGLGFMGAYIGVNTMRKRIKSKRIAIEDLAARTAKGKDKTTAQQKPKNNDNSADTKKTSGTNLNNNPKNKRDNGRKAHDPYARKSETQQEREARKEKERQQDADAASAQYAKERDERRKKKQEEEERKRERDQAQQAEANARTQKQKEEEEEKARQERDKQNEPSAEEAAQQEARKQKIMDVQKQLVIEAQEEVDEVRKSGAIPMFMGNLVNKTIEVDGENAEVKVPEYHIIGNISTAEDFSKIEEQLEDMLRQTIITKQQREHSLAGGSVEREYSSDARQQELFRALVNLVHVNNTVRPDQRELYAKEVSVRQEILQGILAKYERFNQ